MKGLSDFDEKFWVSLDNLIQESTIIIDRPKGSAHLRFPDFIYPADYGYLEGTTAMDGGGIDVWIDSEEPRRLNGILCTLDWKKKDSEMKILLACSEQERSCIYRVMNEHGMNALWLERGEAT